jgi:phosphodiesterase/alkaline phosphatase D-like protein
MNAYDHYRESERALDTADRIANAGRYDGDRDQDVINALARAQVHATLALAGDIHTTMALAGEIEALSGDGDRLHSVKTQ